MEELRKALIEDGELEIGEIEAIIEEVDEDKVQNQMALLSFCGVFPPNDFFIVLPPFF